MWPLTAACACHVTSHILLPLAPDDYTAIDVLTVTFAPNDAQQSVPFSTASDMIAEPTENFTASLSTSDTQVTLFDSIADVAIVNIGGI